MNTVVSFAVLLATVIVCFLLTGPDRTAVQVLLPPLLVAAVFPMAFFPASKTLWTAIELVMVPLRPDEAPGLGIELEPGTEG